MNVIIETVQLMITIPKEVPVIDTVGGSGSLGAVDSEKKRI